MINLLFITNFVTVSGVSISVFLKFSAYGLCSSLKIVVKLKPFSHFTQCNQSLKFIVITKKVSTFTARRPNAVSSEKKIAPVNKNLSPASPVSNASVYYGLLLRSLVVYINCCKKCGCKYFTKETLLSLFAVRRTLIPLLLHHVFGHFALVFSLYYYCLCLKNTQ